MSNKDKVVNDNNQRQSVVPVNESKLLISSKGTLKWLSDYEHLCYAIERLQLKLEKWTTPRGQSKQFENSDVVICWYEKTGTLTFKANKANEIKENLLYFVNKTSEKAITDSVSPKCSNLHSTINPQDSNLHKESKTQSNIHINPSGRPNATSYISTSENLEKKIKIFVKL